MLTYPDIDPVIVSLGPLQVRWYGLMYVLGFGAAWLLVRRQLREFKWRTLEEQFDNLNLFLILGVILGGRLGYVLFYQPGYYLRHPMEILATWQGGMSFHGGCIGVIMAGALFCRRHNLDFWKGADLYAATIPIGLGLGRLGNFLNAELYGRITGVPWGMVFPDGGPLPRHPSQLYEAALEGLLLFLILWNLRKKPWREQSRFWPHGSIMALFLILYGVFRIFVELFREPDAFLGTVLLNLTMGQVLSLTMVVLGLALWLWRGRSFPAGSNPKIA